MRYCKNVIGILLLCCCLLLLWGCGADKAAITQEAEPWVIYQGIVIGQDDLDTVKAALGNRRRLQSIRSFIHFAIMVFLSIFIMKLVMELNLQVSMRLP